MKKKKGKGYYYDILWDKFVFGGDYLNWKILKGKGKEYKMRIYDGKSRMIFEGEYLKGKKL